MSIRFGGISSGLDTSTIVQQLMQVERQPLIQLQNKQLMVDLKKELLGEVSSSLSSLQSKISSFFSDSTWNLLTGSSTDEDIVSFTTDEDSIVGTYEFSDIELATATRILGTADLVTGAATAAQVVSSSAMADASTTALDTFATFATNNGAVLDYSGTFSVNGYSFTIAADTTIDDLMSQVNASDAGVTMSYDTGADKFTIETTETGGDATITLSDTTGFLSAANLASGTTTGGGTVDTSGKLTAAETGITGLASDAGTFYFRINGYAFSFDENRSLEYVINTVNSSGAGVNMLYDSSTDRVVLTNKDTGNQDITLEDVQGNFLEKFGLTVGAKTMGQDASFTLNGVAGMTRSSNQFEINGITFNLEAASVAGATVTVEKDTEGLATLIQEFVTQYNATVSYLNTRLSEEKITGATTESQLRKGLLRGDSTVVGIRSALREIATSNVSGLSNIYDSLSDIGITTTSDDFGKSGLLEIDTETLEDALENNLDAVRKLFLDDTDADEKLDDGEIGVFASLYNKIESYVSTSTTSINGNSYKTGVIAMRIDSMDDQIDYYDDQIADYEDRLEMIETRYWRQFTALEEALSSLQNQSSWLSGQLSSLPSMSSS